jgi:hypothetical protein
VAVPARNVRRVIARSPLDLTIMSFRILLTE